MNKDTATQFLPLVKALAEGKIIQYKSRSEDKWADSGFPCFSDDPERYRIKPEPLTTVGYKRYAYYNCNRMLGVGVFWKGDTSFAGEASNGFRFVKWIDTEWQYHTIEQDNV